MRLKRLAGGLAVAAVVLLKSVPAIAMTPWACALVDAACLALLMRCARRVGLHAALCVAVLIPLVDWLQGGVSGYWVPFMAAGYAAAARLWLMDARGVTRAVLCAVAAYAGRVAGVTVGYVLLREMAAALALRSVVRNSWFYFAWDVGAVAVCALPEYRRKKV